MSNIHSLLKFKTNIKTIIIWAIILFILLKINKFNDFYMLISGLLLGSIGGTMQYLSFLEDRNSFLTAETMMEIRNITCGLLI